MLCRPSTAALAALLGLSILALSAADCIASVVTEAVVEDDGLRLVRTVTLADGRPIETVPAEDAPVLRGRLKEASYLWLDTAHNEASADDIAISGDGSFCIVGWWLNNMRTAGYTFYDDNLPEWTRPMPGIEFQIRVDASNNAERMTSTARHDSLYVFSSFSEDPLFSNDYTPPLLGYHCSVSDAGGTYAGAAGEPGGPVGEVNVYDATGALRFRDRLSDPPEGVHVSADGSVVVSNVRSYAKVWDVATGALRDSVPIPGDAQQAAVISGDGSYVVTGGFSHIVRLYEWDGLNYGQLWASNITGTTWITSLAISDDGSTIAAGTWSNPNGGKVVLFDRSSSTPLWVDSSYGDWVSDLALTPDGEILIAGSWGRSQATVGNIVSVYERGSSTPIDGVADDSFAGVGSCFSVDVSEDGRKVVACGKAIHAREFGRGGWVMAIDRSDPAAVTGWEVAPRGITLRATPNPFRGSTRITASRELESTLAGLQIIGAEGRLILPLPSLPAGGEIIWDGRDQNGRAVPAGVYYLTGPTEAVAQPACLTRIR